MAGLVPTAESAGESAAVLLPVCRRQRSRLPPLGRIVAAGHRARRGRSAGPRGARARAPDRQLRYVLRRVAARAGKFTDRPIAFYGHCLGGITLYEAARAAAGAARVRAASCFRLECARAAQAASHRALRGRPARAAAHATQVRPVHSGARADRRGLHRTRSAASTSGRARRSCPRLAEAPADAGDPGRIPDGFALPLPSGRGLGRAGDVLRRCRGSVCHARGCAGMERAHADSSSAYTYGKATIFSSSMIASSSFNDQR